MAHPVFRVRHSLLKFRQVYTFPFFISTPDACKKMKASIRAAAIRNAVG
ncbi:hypothetical protein B0G93_12946 [Bacillus sp. V-88]|jgi:hypothetical protein|nr:hypothetical protein B0G93_12946 [Bacillus sp. V-88]SLK24687.1 hypothetical protein SAMN06295884_12946 [Bacillus sp. V-88]